MPIPHHTTESHKDGSRSVSPVRVLTTTTTNYQRHIAIIGGGLYGIYTALTLADAGFDVTLFERHAALFSGTSGQHSIRLHAGPHYPRSAATRASCRSALREFTRELPQLVAPLSMALYAVGERDIDGKESRTDVADFESVCQECDGCELVEHPESLGFAGVRGVWSVYEPVMYQDSMKTILTHRIKKHSRIRLQMNHTVRNITEVDEYRVSVDGVEFDWAINCTFFTSFSTGSILKAPVVYQPSVVLYYDDMESGRGVDLKPFTFTVMDGWFPCLMPVMYKHSPKESLQRYMMYHAKYTLLGSYASYDECVQRANSVTEEWVTREVRPRMESHMQQFMPKFGERFQYTGFHVDTVTKLRSNTEFRASLVWRRGRIVHEFSGKVHECVEAARKVLSIVREDSLISDLGPGGVNVQDQVAVKAMGELTQLRKDSDGACDMGVHRW